MKQEVFKGNYFVVAILPVLTFIFITAGIIALFNIDNKIPVWAYTLYIIPVVFAMAGQATKLIVEDGMLRYKYGIFFKRVEEVDLKNVSKIEIRMVKRWVEDSEGKPEIERKKYAYVMGDSDRVFFPFSADLINRKNRPRFEAAVNEVNPTIKINDYI
ncbi:MAG TPA: hypothetical protein VFF20_08715 [Pseudogracilibacillus sp.]|nr:hypothetical protein [Pseudogracilibacillus sp.]